MKWSLIEEAPISESSWLVNSMIIVAKPNGKSKICLGPSNMDKATKHNHHHLPTTEKILPNIYKSRC